MTMQQPLANLRVAITRQSERADDFARRLRELGAIPLICPAISIVPPADWTEFDAALQMLGQFDWLVVTSVNTATILDERMARLNLGVPEQLRVAAIGPATAKALQDYGWQIACVPSANVAEGLLAALGSVDGQRILLPQADIARPVLRDGLVQAGAMVTTITAYHTVADERATELARLLDANAVDIVTFTSGSTVRATCEALALVGASHSLLERAALASIGPITSTAIREMGLDVALEAVPHTLDGLLAALITWHEHTRNFND